MATRVGIVGASGFTGAELLRLLAGHPDLEVVVATGDSQAGTAVAGLYPSLAAAYPTWPSTPTSPAWPTSTGSTSCSAACPTAPRQEIVPGLLRRPPGGGRPGADFRLKDAALYPTWYGVEHTVPELLAEARLRPARAVPRPSCAPPS